MRIVGFGLVSLDVLYEAVDGRLCLPTAGGTMGNVLTILSTLGWSATPIAKIGNDHAGMIVRDDLASFDVNCAFLDFDAAIDTPIWVEYFDRIGGDGAPSHFYERTCPICRGRLPSFTSPPAELLASAQSVLD